MLARALTAATCGVLAPVVLFAAVAAAITLALGTTLTLGARSNPATSAGDNAASGLDPATGSPATAPQAAGNGAAGQSGTGTALPAALADIPPNYLQLYQQAARTCPGLSWAVLAGIGKIESNHGRSTLPGVAPGTVNSAGAGGPMQFLAPTFNSVVARHAIPPGGQNPPSLYNAHDAIYAAAYYLCDNGARDGANINATLWNYNHSLAYRDQVLAQANRYYQAAVAAQPHTPATPSPDQTRSGSPSPSDPAIGTGSGAAQAGTVARVLAFARAQIGTPYVWGGNGPEVNGGFDCSGLTVAAYHSAGINLPRTAQLQYNAGPRLPAGSVAQPGDLVFFGTGPGHVTHVGIATSSTTMVNAPDIGTTVRNDPIPHNLVGITRPTPAP